MPLRGRDVMCLLPACVEDLPREFAFFRKNFPAVKEKGKMVGLTDWRAVTHLKLQ